MPKATGLFSKWLRSVVSVNGGRGFVIQTRDEQRLVVTTAHCLPHLPLTHGLSGSNERTYEKLLGPLGGERTVWADCQFVDPVADLAVLGSPDSQALFHEPMAYDELLEETTPLALGTLSFTMRETLKDGTEIFSHPYAESEAWLLALSGNWFPCRVMSRGRSLWISEAAEGVRSGMSGSPIVAWDGRVIGVVCLSAGNREEDDDRREGGPHPFLCAHLPSWLAGGLLKLPRRRLRQKAKT